MSTDSSDPGDRPPAAPGDPALRAFLPMVYVAWADGDLEAAEIRAICDRVTATLGEDASCTDALGRWLDPERPPGAGELAGLLTAIRSAAAGLGPARRRSLTELGLDLARAAGHETAPAERRALAELEEALGIAGPEAARALLVPARPAPEPAGLPPAFDPTALTRLLDGEQRPERERLRELLCRPEFRRRDGLSRAAYREQVWAWAGRLAEEGIGELALPPELGGPADRRTFLAAFETLAFHDLSLLIKLGVQFGLFGGSILQLGTESHHRHYLPAVATLELPGCFAMTETAHGSNVQELETTARYDRERQEFVLDTPRDGARKDYIGGVALHARMATVFAQLEIDGHSHGVHALLVPIRDEDGEPLPDVRIEDCGEKLGLNGVDNGRLWFDGVRVPRENLLDRFATVAADGTYASPIASPTKRFFVMLGTLVGGRVSIAHAAQSAAKSALAIAIRYGDRRRQFGAAGEPETALLDYLSHQRRLLPRLATTYALHFALAHLAARWAGSRPEDRREVEGLAAGLKAFATRHATDTIQECREACGGQGYLAENRFAALKADTDVFTTFEGDNTVLLQLVTKGLLTGYRRQFEEMRLAGLVRYLAGRAAHAVSELNPIVTRLTDEDHLRSRDFQLAAFAWREDHLLGSLARRLKRRIDSGLDSFHALVACQDHALALARAHVERLVIEQFAAGLEAHRPSLDEHQLTEPLTLLCDLFALARLEADKGWFLEHGYFDPPKSKAIRNLVNRLCGELRPHAVPLVDAFGIPDELLAAPIAR